MKNMRNFLSSLLLLACILCGTSSAFAQGTNLGTIRGRVTDQHEAAVKGAAVSPRVSCSSQQTIRRMAAIRVARRLAAERGR